MRFGFELDLGLGPGKESAYLMMRYMQVYEKNPFGEII